MNKIQMCEMIIKNDGRCEGVPCPDCPFRETEDCDHNIEYWVKSPKMVQAAKRYIEWRSNDEIQY